MFQRDRRTNVPGSIALAVALSVALIGAAPAPPPAAAPDVNPFDPPAPRVVLLTGRVTILNKSLPKANVRLLRGGVVVANTLSRADGTYRFSDAAPGSGVAPVIPAGSYALEAQYRTSPRAAGAVALRAAGTQRRTIERPGVALLGGAAPTPPRTTFFITDRVPKGGSTIDDAFSNE